jgi:large repetitive protein
MTGTTGTRWRRAYAPALAALAVALAIPATAASAVEPDVSVAPVTVTEGNTGTSLATVELTLSGASANALSFDWATLYPVGYEHEARPWLDYQPSSGTVVFAPGDTSESVTVPIFGDTTDEFDETIGLAVRPQHNPTGVVTSTITITDDDAQPTLLPSIGWVDEDNAATQLLQVPIALSAPSGKPVTVEWTTLNVPGAPGRQAFSPDDYTAASGTVVLPPGTTSALVDIQALDDEIVEIDEYVVVSFRNQTNAALGGFWGIGFGAIVD